MAHSERQSERPRILNVPRHLKPYYLVMLRKGARWNDPEGAEDLMARQLAFFREQIEAGRYVVCGPVLSSPHTGGASGETAAVCIATGANADEAIALANEDPAVASGRLVAEVHAVLLPALDGVVVGY